MNGDDVVARSYLGGYPSFSLFAYRYAGLDRTGDPQIRLSDKSVTKTPHVSTPADIRYMGTYQPAWSGGLSNIFHYRMFTLNINIIYNLGYSMRRDANSFYSGRLIKNLSAELFTGNVHGEFANRWRQPGDESRTNIPGYIGSSALSDGRRETDYYTLGDLNVVSASYAKIRDMGLSYNLPHGFTERLKMNELTFRLQVSNIMIWKANKYGIDPEFQDAFAGQRTLPVNQHAFTVGLHASF